MEKKLLLLYNPRAGKSEVRGKLSEIVEVFVRGGYRVTVRPTLRAGELPELLRENAGDYDLMVCCGGDGTLNEAVNGLMGCAPRPVLGYIPAGTVNDFASSFGIPKDLEGAARWIAGGKPAACDVGHFEGERYFAYVAAFGAFTDVPYETSQQVKNLLGRMAYFLEGMRLKHLTKYRPHAMTLRYDGGEMKGEYLVGMVTNATSVGGHSFSPGRDVAMDDGVLEGTFIENPGNALELQQVINALLSQNTLDCPFIHTFCTTKLTAVAEEALPWTLDGEFGGSHREVSISCEKQALRIMAGE